MRNKKKVLGDISIHSSASQTSVDHPDCSGCSFWRTFWSESLMWKHCRGAELLLRALQRASPPCAADEFQPSHPPDDPRLPPGHSLHLWWMNSGRFSRIPFITIVQRVHKTNALNELLCKRFRSNKKKNEHHGIDRVRNPVTSLPIGFDLLMSPHRTHCHLPLTESLMKYVWLTHDNRMSKRKLQEQ